MTYKCHYIFFLSFALCIQAHAQNFIQSNNRRIYYQGRIEQVNDAAMLSWPGTSATIHFQGTGVSAVLKDADTANYYNVIIDDTTIFKIHTDTVKRSYRLAADLPAGKHNVQLFKRTEWDKGKTWFYGFELQNETTLLPPLAPPKRKIEFYGNSITCGYAMEDSSGNDSPVGFFENNYLSYAAITARHFNAEYFCIAKSGIGMMVSWFHLIMPEMYDRLDATDSLSKWNFKKYTPDIVVINLFQNDSWIVTMPQNEQFKNRFESEAPDSGFIINAYKNFVQSLRKKYPQASIICALGNMDATREGSSWPGYVQQAADELNDKKIYTLFFRYKNTPGHPKVNEQQDMADSLIKFIDENILW